MWNVNEYTLTVKPNGGTWNNTTSNSTFTQEYGTTKTISNPTVPNGYTVTYNGNGGTSSLQSAKSTKLFTGWTKDGAGTLSGTTYTFGAGNGTLTANYENNSIKLPSATRVGYNFAGWYTAETGGEKVGGAGSDYIPTANVILYAQWELIEYTITYNNYSGNSFPTTYTIESETITLSPISQTNKIFIGWTGDNGNIKQYNPSIPKGSTGDKIFTANWLDSTIYRFDSALGNYSIDVEGGNPLDTTPIQIYDNAHHRNHSFYLKPVNGEWFKIETEIRTNGVLDVSGGSSANGTKLELYTYNGTNAQLWKLIDAGDGYYYIQSKLGTVIDIPNASAQYGVNLQMYQLNYTNAQKWKLVKKPGTIYTITYQGNLWYNKFTSNNNTGSKWSDGSITMNSRIYPSIYMSGEEAFSYRILTSGESSRISSTNSTIDSKMTWISRMFPGDGSTVQVWGVNVPANFTGNIVIKSSN